MDGALVPWHEANVHILTHTLHYGLGVFEGIRCYRTDDGRSAVFRLPEHVRRLYESAHINLMKADKENEARFGPFVAALCKETRELLEADGPADK